MEVVLIVLLQFIRENKQNDLDVQIAKILIENINRLNTLSLEKMAEMCHCSTSSFTRFLKKVGFSHYRLFKNLLIQPQLVYHHEGFKQDLFYQQTTQNIQFLDEQIQTDSFNRILKDIKEAKTIKILAFPTNLAYTLAFQCKMILAGKPVEVFSLVDNALQVQQLSHEDVLFLISFQGHYNNLNLEEILKKNQTKMILITQNQDNHWLPYAKEVIYTGKYHDFGEENYGLIYFFDSLYQAYLQKHVKS